MSEEYIDWKSRALAAEAETLNLKNLCAHHGICTACGEYYSHHYIEPFATCNCNTSEWYELTEYMKLQNELRKLRKDAEWMNGNIVDLRKSLARYHEREMTMGWNNE